MSEARIKRDTLRKQLHADLDPSAERKATNLRKTLAAENSFEAVAREWYTKQLHTWVPHHADDVRGRLEPNIFPVLGKRPLEQIEARGYYDLAHRVLQVCGQVFRYGIATERCTRNLSTDLRGALTPHVKQHFVLGARVPCTPGFEQPEYVPDFVAATSATNLLIETKKAMDMNAADVTAKAKAAVQWCVPASDYSARHGGKVWQYLLIPHDAVQLNATLDALETRFALTVPVAQN